jgi:hypothetical protein
MPLVTSDPLPAEALRSKLAEWLFQYDHIGYQMVGSACFVYKLPTLRQFRALERAEAQDPLEAGLQFLKAIQLSGLPRLKPAGLADLLRVIINEHYPFEEKLLADVDMVSAGRQTTLVGIIDTHLSALGTDKQIWDLNYEQITDLLGKKVVLTGQPLVKKKKGSAYGNRTRQGSNVGRDGGTEAGQGKAGDPVEAGVRRDPPRHDGTHADRRGGNEAPQSNPRAQPEAHEGIRPGREARGPQAGPGSAIRGS